jgi:hypothetical protein
MGSLCCGTCEEWGAGLDLRRVLVEFPLQGPAVEAEEFCGLGDVAVTIGENALDMLPLDAGEAGDGGAEGREGIGGGIETAVGGEDLFGVGGFRHVVVSAEPGGGEGGGDAAVAGEDDDAEGFVEFAECADDIETADAGEAEVDEGEVRGQEASRFDGGRAVGSAFGLPAAVGEGAAEAGAEDVVVIDNEDD